MTGVNSLNAGNLLAEKLHSVAAPIFAATLAKAGKSTILTVHVSSTAGRQGVASAVQAAVAGAFDGKVVVRFHSSSTLMAPRSLERLVRQFGGDEIIYDPTMAMGRASALVNCGRSVRVALGDRLTGLFYAPRHRTLFVALNPARLARGEKVKIGELASIERDIVASLRTFFAGQPGECPAIRVGFGLPGIELVPVDQLSVRRAGNRFVQALRRYWKPAAIAAMLGFGAAGAAQAKDPAVSQTNFKAIGTTSIDSGKSAWVAGGALTAPIGNDWGFQVEAAAAGMDDDLTTGVAGHLFTRDPDKYLLGVFAAYAQEDDFGLEATRVGAEAEIYLNQISLLAKAGYQFSSSLGDAFAGSIELRWYITDNFAVSGGAELLDESSLGRASVEWQPGFSALPGLAFRFDGAWGDDDYESLMGGISYYFGADASLKSRHRHQDPDLVLLNLFKQVEAEREKLCAQYGGC